MGKLYCLLMIAIIIIVGCNDKNNVEEEITGQVVFYSNAQAMLNCGSFDVNVFIDSALAGAISNPYVNDELPECNQSDNTLVIEKESGTINYYAKISCDDYIQWTGSVNVKPDSCHKVFLDIENAEDLRPKGRTVFYTNVLGLIDGNSFLNAAISVFVDNDSVGAIIETTGEGDPEPDCINSEQTVLVEKEPGIYNYYAELNVNKNANWSSEFEILQDSCTKVFLNFENATGAHKAGLVRFYTNAQALYNCKPYYYVEVFVDNDSLGRLWEPCTDTIAPYCFGSNSVLFLATAIGSHNYTAKSSCGDIEWSGEFEIFPDSCINIFLDVSGKF